jgi:hypothetical protein
MIVDSIKPGRRLTCVSAASPVSIALVARLILVPGRKNRTAADEEIIYIVDFAIPSVKGSHAETFAPAPRRFCNVRSKVCSGMS